MISTAAFRRFRFLSLLSLAILAACSGSPGDSPAQAAFSSDDGILRYVPADSPYVFAALEPLPADVQQKLSPHVTRIVRAYADLLKAGLTAQSGEADAAPVDEERMGRIAAVIEELAPMITVEGIPEAGIDRNSTAAFYGVGLLPVLRVTLSDADRFEATVSRLESRAGAKLQVAAVDGHPYRFAGTEQGRLVFAVIGNQLVITATPANLADATFKTLLGLTLPQQNIAESGTLAALATKYGFKSYGLGTVDIERIAATFIDDQAGVNAELLELLDYDVSELSDVCKSEMRSIAGLVPRIVTGYTDISTRHFKGSTTVELRSDIAAGAQTLTAPVPGLGMEQGGLMSFGMSLNLVALREFYSSRLDALEADPFECEHFSGIQEGVANGRAWLSQPIPPAAYSFRGFLAVVDKISGMDIRKQQPPTDIEMRLLLASDNPEALVATGAMFSPEIAAMNLQPDSKPVKLEIPALAAAVNTAYIARSEAALALSLGRGAESGLQEMLAADLAEPPPFVSVSMDAQRYYGFIRDAMAVSDSPGRSPQVAKATADMMTALEKMFSRISSDVNFTANGIEVPSTMELAD